jgi:hypothetical protein
MKPTPEIDQQAYELAKGYLPSLEIPGVTEDLIKKYMGPNILHPDRPTSIKGLKGLYFRILDQAQNANMKTGVIGGSIGGVDKLAPILHDFDPGEVLAKYGVGWEAVLDQIIKELNPHGKIRRTPRSIWPQYCKTILSAARFIEQFDSANDFFDWADFFDRDARARPSLPMLLDREIEGFGFALSCDFLKELGYINFPKPDVHLRDIFMALELCEDGKDQYQLFKAIIRVANNSKVTPYNVDKVFWLIGSGNFYWHPEIGKIGRHKQRFIDFARSKLYGNK